MSKIGRGIEECRLSTTRKISQLSDNHKIKSYHHADSRFVVVSAASILAKVARDRAIMKLREDHNLGSGYPSDSVTVKFVTKYYKKNNEMPKFVRKSWKPVQRIIEKN